LKHLLLVALLLPIAAHADEYRLTIRDHKFQPAELAIPSGTRIKLKVENQDGIPVEFESTDLSREVIVSGKGQVTIYIGPLSQGSYRYFNDFNRDIQGVIVAKPAVGKEN
jgi:hypothetical protein